MKILKVLLSVITIIFAGLGCLSCCRRAKKKTLPASFCGCFQFCLQF